MVKLLENNFKGENYIQIPIRIKDNMQKIAGKYRLWNISKKENFNGEKVSIIAMQMGWKMDKFQHHSQ